MATQAVRGEGLPLGVGERERIDVPALCVVVRLLGQGGLAPMVGSHHAADQQQEQQGVTRFNHIKQSLASLISRRKG